ncbi:hypothetical protein ACIBCM_10885 [Streptomyces sp. NPDC051018]|uniref:hypothetical protein n=1 Tax=Streptomyces sp. NPDC051018 TaxID=3365639 RepID=UPI0037930809
MTGPAIPGRGASSARTGISALSGLAEVPRKTLERLIRDGTQGIGEAEHTAGDILGDPRKQEQDHREGGITAGQWRDEALTPGGETDGPMGAGRRPAGDTSCSPAEVGPGRRPGSRSLPRARRPGAG